MSVASLDPMAIGLNESVIEQLAFALSIPGQLSDSEKSATLGPVMLGFESDSDVLPPLVSEIVLAALGVFTFCFPKFSDTELSCACGFMTDAVMVTS
jgi:hypothetical protein